MKKKKYIIQYYSIPVDPVFGEDLTDVWGRDELEIPKFFTELVKYIEMKGGLNTVGLYKQSANPAGVNLLKEFIEKGIVKMLE